MSQIILFLRTVDEGTGLSYQSGLLDPHVNCLDPSLIGEPQQSWYIQC